MGRKLRSLCPAAISAVALLTLSACMLTPFDNQRVPLTTSPIEFFGGHPSPKAKIAIEAFDGQKWIEIGNTTSSEIRFSIGNIDLYAWSIEVVLDRKYWEPVALEDGNNFRAKVRARSGASLVSVQEGVNRCILENQSLRGFLDACAGPDSPEATVYALCAVGANVTYRNCSQDVQRAVGEALTIIYDNLGVDSFGGCLDGLPDLRNRMLDYLTCKPLEIACELPELPLARHPTCADSLAGTLGFWDDEEWDNGLRRIHLCPSEEGFPRLPSVPSVLTAHELSHLAQADVAGRSDSQSEDLAEDVGVNCGAP